MQKIYLYKNPEFEKRFDLIDLHLMNREWGIIVTQYLLDII